MEGTSMKPDNITREELWARQNLSATSIDYAVWERDKAMLLQMAKINRTCTFVVDVYKCRYAFASSNFSDLLGYDSHKLPLSKNRATIWNHVSIRTIASNWRLSKSGWENSFTASLPLNGTTIAIFTVSVSATSVNNTYVSSVNIR